MIHCLCLWPTWSWMAQRAVDGSDDPWGLMALASCMVIAWIKTRQPRGAPQVLCLGLPIILLCVYALSYPWAPHLVRAALGLTSLAALMSPILWRQTFHVGYWGLTMLSLPLLASLQFYFGYPLRVLVGYLSIAALRLSGYTVTLDGIGLRWGDQLVMIDAPCSGVKMLWVAGFLVGLLACRWSLSNRQTILAATLSLITIILGNALRAIALFVLETAPVCGPHWLHSGVGLLVFAVSAIAIVGVIRWIQAFPKALPQ